MPPGMSRGCRALGFAAMVLFIGPARAQSPAPDLPRYDLLVRLDTCNKVVRLHERVTWTNRHARPADELVFTIYPLYRIPDKDVGLLAKTVEILRQAPSVALNIEPAGKLNAVRLAGREVPFVV